MAEPFLLVGIIASIKEIVILSVKAAEETGDGAKFRDQLWEIGVLAVAVLPARRHGVAAAPEGARARRRRTSPT